MKFRRVRFPQSLALGLAVMLAVAGCSNLPTQPQLTQPEAGATGATGAPAEVLGFDLLGGSSAQNSNNSKTAVIGILGGVVSVGDFTVIVPPAALTRTAAITVTQPDLGHPVVELSIAPATANHFLVPVLLVADAKRMNPSLLSVAFISYYNPATKQWERVTGSSVSILDLTVTAPLSHFSTYRVQAGGKAGW